MLRLKNKESKALADRIPSFLIRNYCWAYMQYTLEPFEC